MHTHRLISALAAACLALAAAVRADALIMIHQPRSDYVASTSLIDISALTDGDDYGAISDGSLIVTFGTPMMRLTVPDTWNTWNTPPDTETDTPPVLWSEGATSVLMTLSSPQLVFGFEAQPDLSDVETMIATFFDETASPIGAIVRDVSGNGGALLFAASSPIPIASVLFTDAADEGFGIANVRYSSQIFVPMPEPASVVLVAAGLALLLFRSLHHARGLAPGAAMRQNALRHCGTVRGAQRMNLKLIRLLVVSAAVSLGSCVVYEPVPASSQPTLQQRFDRSWAAASGAMSDQGLTITAQDRGSGVIRENAVALRSPPRLKRWGTAAFR
jgi:hypothetical protein